LLSLNADFRAAARIELPVFPFDVVVLERPAVQMQDDVLLRSWFETHFGELLQFHQRPFHFAEGSLTYT
jgi:hypothetical protein